MELLSLRGASPAPPRVRDAQAGPGARLDRTWPMTPDLADELGRALTSAQFRLVEPRISTAMTPGGGVAGIGFDGTGFGEGSAARISPQMGNDQGDDE
jgi:hypothetical protein